MSLLDWIRRRGRRLSGEQALCLAKWRDLPEADAKALHAHQRFVVVDVESSGLNVFRDHLIAIGAVAVEGGRISLGDSFYRVLRQARASSHANILVHGIGGTEQTGGADPAGALLDFLDFIGKSPLAGFHTDFDDIMIRKAMRLHLGEPFRCKWLDLAYLAPALCRSSQGRPTGLDDWLQSFGINNYRRHDALADALATAQMFQLLACRAAQSGELHTANLLKLADAQEWLSRSLR